MGKFLRSSAWLGVILLHAVGSIRDSQGASTSTRLLKQRGTPGFWRLVQQDDGVWWFLSPSGHREFLDLVGHVLPEYFSRSQDGRRYQSKDYAGNDQRWAQETADRVQSMGFKGVGGWSALALEQAAIPFTTVLGLSQHGGGQAVKIFDPLWEQSMAESARNQLLGLKNNKNLVGYYLDNEIDFTDEKFYGALYYFNSPDPLDPNHLKVLSVIQSLWSSPAEFSADWGVTLNSWDELREMPQLPPGNNLAYLRLSQAWLKVLMHHYFSKTTALVRSIDPHHLILGTRYRSWIPEEVVAASADYTDAQSINIYDDDATLDENLIDMMVRVSKNQPIMISEYSFYSDENSSGNLNLSAWSGHVVDQKARADAFRIFNSRLAQQPFFIGSEWFQWADESPDGQGWGEDVAFGIVDIFDRPYPALVQSILQTSPRLNGLHAASAQQHDPSLWQMARDYSQKLSIAGALRDDEVKVNCEGESDVGVLVTHASINHAVGVDRLETHVPRIYLAMTATGIFIEGEMSDPQLSAALDHRRWKNGDYLQFWFKAIPQNENLSSNTAPPTESLVLLPGGEFKLLHDDRRMAQAMPGLSQCSVATPEGYRFKVFIPFSFLPGFDSSPRNFYFNYVQKDWQRAVTFYWARPDSFNPIVDYMDLGLVQTQSI